jgi:hypothetical protein
MYGRQYPMEFAAPHARDAMGYAGHNSPSLGRLGAACKSPDLLIRKLFFDSLINRHFVCAARQASRR